MADVNRVILMGRLGGDPNRHTTKTGLPMTSFSLATGMKRKDAETHELKDATQWHHVVAWGREAETCAQYLRKGSKVYIEGSYRSRTYTGNDGQPKQRYEVHVDRVNFVEKNQVVEERLADSPN